MHIHLIIIYNNNNNLHSYICIFIRMELYTTKKNELMNSFCIKRCMKYLYNLYFYNETHLYLQGIQLYVI